MFARLYLSFQSTGTVFIVSSAPCLSLYIQLCIRAFIASLHSVFFFLFILFNVLWTLLQK